MGHATAIVQKRANKHATKAKSSTRAPINLDLPGKQ